MNIKTVLIFFSLLFPLLINAQTVNIYFNNTIDERTQKQGVINAIAEIKTKFGNIIDQRTDYNKSDFTFDIIFLDPTHVGNLELKNDHNAKDLMVSNWETENLENLSFLFYFLKDGDNYILKDFVVSDIMKDGQIPELVEIYIKNNIALEDKTKINNCIINTINALKNSFDLRFKEKLITESQNLFKINYYYRHYAFIPFAYYYFETQIDENFGNINISFDDAITHDKPLFVNNGGVATINDLYSDNDLSYNVNGTNYNIDKANDLIYLISGGSRTIITNYSNFKNKVYIDLSNAFVKSNNELVCFNSIAEYQSKNYFAKTTHLKYLYSILEKIKDSDKHFKAWNYIDNDGVSFYEAPKYNFCQVKVFSNIAQKGDYIGNINRTSIYQSDPTWCNKYALELSNRIYGEDPNTNRSPVPYDNDEQKECTANMLYSFFLKHTDIYIEIKEKSVDIWDDYINKGYPVYFSSYNSNGSGHIETGFPDNSINIGNNNLSDDFQEDLSNFTTTNYNSGNKKYCSVGAGATTGFKTFNEYGFLKNTSKAFLYLGYLEKEYN